MYVCVAIVAKQVIVLRSEGRHGRSWWRWWGDVDTELVYEMLK